VGRTLSKAPVALRVSNSRPRHTPWGDGSGLPGAFSAISWADFEPARLLTLRRALVQRSAMAHPGRMTQQAEENRFQHLPEQVRPEDLVETVDTGQPPPRDGESEERERLLRQAGGA
jgi:hypothetical protein